MSEISLKFVKTNENINLNELCYSSMSKKNANFQVGGFISLTAKYNLESLRRD